MVRESGWFLSISILCPFQIQLMDMLTDLLCTEILRLHSNEHSLLKSRNWWTIHYSFFHVSCFEKIYEKSKWQRFCSSLLIRNELKKKHSLFGQWFVILWTLSLVWLKVDSNDLCSCMNLVHMFLVMYTYKCRGIYYYILNYLESNWTPPVSDQYWLLLVVPLF